MILRFLTLLICLMQSAALAEAVYVFDDDVPRATRTNVLNGVKAGETFFAKEMGLRLNAPVKVVASYNDGFRRRNVPARAYYANCNGGYANARLSVICGETEAFNRSQFAGGLRLQQEMVSLHEYVHVVQIELAGGVMVGPPWMNEGFAEHVVMLHKVKKRIVTRRQEAEWHRKKARKQGTPLKSLESRQVFNSNPNSSSTGMAAVDKLHRQAGLLAFRDYYLAIGQGKSWKAAFHVAFGQTVDEFYSEFRP